MDKIDIENLKERFPQLLTRSKSYVGEVTDFLKLHTKLISHLNGTLTATEVIEIAKAYGVDENALGQLRLRLFPTATNANTSITWQYVRMRFGNTSGFPIYEEGNAVILMLNTFVKEYVKVLFDELNKDRQNPEAQLKAMYINRDLKRTEAIIESDGDFNLDCELKWADVEVEDDYLLNDYSLEFLDIKEYHETDIAEDNRVTIERMTHCLKQQAREAVIRLKLIERLETFMIVPVSA